MTKPMTNEDVHCNWIRNECIHHAFKLRQNLGHNEHISPECLIEDAKKFEQYILNKKQAVVRSIFPVDIGGTA